MATANTGGRTRYVDELIVDGSQAKRALKEHGDELDRAARRAQKSMQAQDEFGASTRRSSAPLREQERLLKQTVSQLDRFTRANDPAARTAKKLADAEELINAARRRGAPVTDANIRALEILRRKHEALARAANDNAGAHQRVQRQMVGQTKAVNDNARAHDRLGRSLRTTGAGATGLLAIYVKLAAAMGVGLGVRAFATFEQRLSTVRAVTGATTEQMAAMEVAARRLGATTQFSATQAADGMVFLGRAGFETEQIVSALPGTLDLAAAGALDLGDAADIASNVLTGFQKEASEMGRVADVMAKAAASANTDIKQLGDAMKFVAPVAASLGVELEATTAAIGALSDAGLQGEMAGTGLRGALLSLLQPTPAAAAALERLGLTVDQVNPKTHSLTEVLRRLGEAGLGAGEAVEIAGKRGGTALLVLAQNADKVERLTETLNNAEGAASDMAATMSDNLIGASKRLVSVMTEIAISVGQEGGVGGALTSMLDTLSSGLLVFTQFGDELGENREAAEATARAIQAVTVAAVAMTGAFVAAKVAVGAAALVAGAMAAPFTLAAVAVAGVVAGLIALDAATDDSKRGASEAARAAARLEESTRDMSQATEDSTGAHRENARVSREDAIAQLELAQATRKAALAKLEAKGLTEEDALRGTVDTGGRLGQIPIAGKTFEEFERNQAIVERLTKALSDNEAEVRRLRDANVALNSATRDGILGDDDAPSRAVKMVTTALDDFHAAVKHADERLRAFQKGGRAGVAFYDEHTRAVKLTQDAIDAYARANKDAAITDEQRQALFDQLFPQAQRRIAAEKQLAEAMSGSARAAQRRIRSLTEDVAAMRLQNQIKAIGTASTVEEQLRVIDLREQIALLAIDRQLEEATQRKGVETNADVRQAIDQEIALLHQRRDAIQDGFDIERETATLAVDAAVNRVSAMEDETESIRLRNEIKRIGTADTIEERLRIVDLREQIALLAIDRQIDEATQRQAIETNERLRADIGREIDALEDRRTAIQESFAIDRVKAFEDANKSAAEATEAQWSDTVGSIESLFNGWLGGVFDQFGRFGGVLKAIAGDVIRFVSGATNAATQSSGGLIGGLFSRHSPDNSQTQNRW
jgi:TP901 family phage tail tape measure protein